MLRTADGFGITKSFTASFEISRTITTASEGCIWRGFGHSKGNCATCAAGRSCALWAALRRGVVDLVVAIKVNSFLCYTLAVAFVLPPATIGGLSGSSSHRHDFLTIYYRVRILRLQRHPPSDALGCCGFLLLVLLSAHYRSIKAHRSPVWPQYHTSCHNERGSTCGLIRYG